MKRSSIFTLCFSILIIGCKLLAQSNDPIKYVNTFIGTGGHGHTFPGPVAPFGMIQLGPDTRHTGWDGCGGYHYSDSVIYGFSHTHLSGTGISDYADLLITPQIGTAKTDPLFVSKNGFGHPFKHKNEEATAGYYAVKFIESGISVRLTTTERCGLHEYSFADETEKKYITLDLGYRDRLLEGEIKELSKTHLNGYRRSEAWATNQYFFFDLELNVPFKSIKWVKDEKTRKYVVVLEFPVTTKQILIRVGISGTDELGAEKNLKAELQSWNFNDVRLKAQDKWRNELNQAKVVADEVTKTNFYSALYHSYVHPSLWTDVDGRYRTFNNTIATSSTDLYSVFSIWDTYRGANPLYTLLQPKRTIGFVESYRQQYLNTGLLPVWTLSNNETNCMIGYHAVSVIADAALKGIPLNNKEELLKAMVATAEANNFGKSMFRNNGFISASLEPESVSKTLEYAYDDWCIAQFAQSIGNSEIAEKYKKSSYNWLNLLHPETGFFQPRKGGMWLNNFKPNEVNHHFTEANGWQYSFAAPHHIKTLIQMRGGKKGFEKMLDSLFYGSTQMSGREQADITGLIGQYAHGNEPSHHMAHLYNYCGAPYKTQALLQKIMKEYYAPTPDGLSGNEDCGQMSAWYVLNAMGFYPVAPGSVNYSIGRPELQQVELNIGNKLFQIRTVNNTNENTYIQAIKWNGVNYTKMYITHDMIVNGGVLEIVFGNKPNLDLSSFEMAGDEGIHTDFVTIPYFIAPSESFNQPMVVSIDKLPFEKGAIYFTTDESEPTLKSNKLDKNITLKNTTILKARIIREENGKQLLGPIIETKFTYFSQDKLVELKTPFANHYAGSGSQCLADGIKGGNDYRGTEWQGFEGKDVEMVFTLNEVKDVSSVTASYLQDSKSWIIHPKSIQVWVSLDGVNYKLVGKEVNSKIKDKTEGIILNDFKVDFPPNSAKYVKVILENYGILPSWHIGEGGKSWIFLDEVTVK